LAVAELAKRGLLLPYRLEHLVPLLLQALVYDQMKGYMSVGQNIRDSACYVCWAFARAYEPRDLQPFVQKIATGLLIVTVFDREINCRRAASAAFQESVGRLGTFPHGIDILTAADFYTVGLRTNSYLQISDFIAQYENYTNSLIDHLVDVKTGHWDTAIRELTAKALNKLAPRNVNYMASTVLTKLIEQTDSIDVNLRHGSVLAIGEVLLKIELSLVSPKNINLLNNLIIKFQKREQFRGMSGELMKLAALDFIKNCSDAHFTASQDCIESFQMLIDTCIISKTNRVRELSVAALASLCTAYYRDNPHNMDIVDRYLNGSNNDLEEHIKMGYVLAIGAFSKFMLLPVKEKVVEKLIEHSLVPDENILKQAGLNPIILNWSEARRDSVKAIGNVISTIGFEDLSDENLQNLFECLLRALEEYTIDNRGDIGAWVREASMTVLHQMMISCPRERLNSEIVHKIMSGLAQQSVEKIDRTRAIAGKLFHNLLYHEPKLPHIKNHEILRGMFPQDASKILWLFADHTFPLFCNMLELEEYSEKLLIGLIASIGQLTESLIKYSSSSFLDFLNSRPILIPVICDLILKIFRENLLNERITYPMLNFLDAILSSGTLLQILDDENSNFADEVFRLVNLEIRGHKKLYKIVSSISVMCQLIQVNHF
jgi:tubulin-specific chaperone D